jgi:periplasmic protein TonB
MNRNLSIGLSVVLLHVAALWALQAGLLRRVVEIVVPAQVISELVAEPTVKPPPAPKPVEPPPPAPAKPLAAPQVAAPQPVAVADAPATPSAPVGVTTPQAPAPPMTAPVAVAAPAAPATPPSPPRVELPSSDADYLQNPKPAYPPISKRLGEQGKVMLRVLIGADGSPQKAEIRNSSGFERLDQAALATVMRWRYVPGKRGGVAEAMWFNVPINFVLE